MLTAEKKKKKKRTRKRKKKKIKVRYPYALMQGPAGRRDVDVVIVTSPP
jgi:hypothetical protein